MIPKPFMDILADEAAPLNDKVARYIRLYMGDDLPPVWDGEVKALPSWEAICKETGYDD